MGSAEWHSALFIVPAASSVATRSAPTSPQLLILPPPIADKVLTALRDLNAPRYPRRKWRPSYHLRPVLPRPGPLLPQRRTPQPHRWQHPALRLLGRWPVRLG